MNHFWNERYAQKEFAYGTEPNQFFKANIDQLNLKGNILLPAEGEGRNAIYAAQKGLQVHAFDASIEGQKKALELAQKNNINIQYQVQDMEKIEYEPNSFDVIALIFVHFPPNLRPAYHQKIAKWLKPNGILIFEGFSKKHHQLQKENPKIGGPKKIEILFSQEQLKSDFNNFEFLTFQETNTELNEGKYHIGTASVIQFVGKKW